MPKRAALEEYTLIGDSIMSTILFIVGIIVIGLLCLNLFFVDGLIEAQKKYFRYTNEAMYKLKDVV